MNMGRIKNIKIISNSLLRLMTRAMTIDSNHQERILKTQLQKINRKDLSFDHLNNHKKFRKSKEKGVANIDLLDIFITKLY